MGVFILKPKNQTDSFIPNNKIVWLVYTKFFFFFFPQQVWHFLERGGRWRTKKRSRRKKLRFNGLQGGVFCFVLFWLLEGWKHDLTAGFLIFWEDNHIFFSFFFLNFLVLFIFFFFFVQHSSFLPFFVIPFQQLLVLLCWLYIGSRAIIIQRIDKYIRHSCQMNRQEMEWTRIFVCSFTIYCTTHSKQEDEILKIETKIY